MLNIIVDTNVLIVANGLGNDNPHSCYNKCIEYLTNAFENTLLLDEAGEILEEYSKNVSMGHSPLASRYFMHLRQNQFDPAERIVKRVHLEKIKDTFVDFPKSSALEKFDLSDRKFAALSHKTKTPVTNATDSDWVIFKQPLLENAIHVIFLCGENKKDWK